MSNGDNDIKQYSAEDISRYWQGKLSPQEMHAMEKAAMDDPFLADALEGYSNSNTATVNNDIQELQTRLKERIGGATVVPMKRRTKWWTIAALLILLCGIGALTYILFLQNNNAETQNTAAVVKTDTHAVESAGNKDTNFIAVVPQEKVDTFKANGIASNYSTFRKEGIAGAGWSGEIAKNQKAAGESEKLMADARSKYETDSLEAVATADDKAVQTFNMKAKKATQQNEPPLIAQNEARRNAPTALEGRVSGIGVYDSNRQARATPMRGNDQAGFIGFNNFSGRVLDNNNMPIANVTVRSNNALLTTTDQLGNFNIKSYDTVLSLSANSVGYVPQRFTLRNNQPADVVLNYSDKKLSEVVVSGYGNKKSRDITGVAKKSAPANELKVYVMDAEPVGGWDEFNKYIEKNQRMDSYKSEEKQTADSIATTRNEVVVSFTVSKNGKLSNFNIDKSLGKQEDAEAIRLIKEGPAWRALKNKKSKARVIIPFPTGRQ